MPALHQRRQAWASSVRRAGQAFLAESLERVESRTNVGGEARERPLHVLFAALSAEA